MSENVKLKPCPFCGAHAEINVNGVRCSKTNCAHIYNVLFPEKAVDTWNRRVNP